jgi:hypothetical protein
MIIIEIATIFDIKLSQEANDKIGDDESKMQTVYGESK